MPEYQYPLNIKHEAHVHITTKTYHLPKTDNTTSEIAPSDRLAESYFYIPSALVNSAGTSWTPEDINNIAQEIVAGSKGVDGFWNNVEKYSGVGGRFLIGAMDKIAPGATSSLTKTASGLGGKLLKPNSVLILNEIQRFNLNLTWELTPQSPEEGKMVQDIIKAWKKWSLPTLKVDSAKMWLDYPPIFDIKIKTGMAGVSPVSSKSFNPSEDLFAYQDMVLETFSATYNGGANEALFYEDGTPITTSFNLGFKALKPGWNEQYENSWGGHS